MTNLYLEPSLSIHTAFTVVIDEFQFVVYQIPGAILFSILGIGPLVAAFAVFRKMRWAWWSVLAVGGGLVIWITVQISMIGYIEWPSLQAFYGLVGLAILGLALHPISRRELLGPDRSQ